MRVEGLGCRLRVKGGCHNSGYLYGEPHNKNHSIFCVYFGIPL